MKGDITSDFADFLEERLGNALNTLRENSKEYRELSDEHAELMNGKYQTVDEYRQAVSKLAEIYAKLDDIEKHYLFLAGMREHAKMESSLLSEDFEKLFAGTE